MNGLRFTHPGRLSSYFIARGLDGVMEAREKLGDGGTTKIFHTRVQPLYGIYAGARGYAS